MVILQVRDNYGVEANLDILNEAELLVDISAIESGDIGEVFGLSSQEFMLPGTDNNNKFFANMYDIGADLSIALNHSIYASVLVDGQEIFAGRMYVNDVLTDDKGYVMYKAVVVNEFVDFKLRIEDLTLRDLDFTSLEHNFNYGNITSSWDGNLVNGDVVYPLIDYGSSPTTTIARDYGYDIINGVKTVRSGSFTSYHTPLEIMDFKPGVKVKAIIDAIFNKVNYNYSSSFLEGSYFDKIFMLSTNTDQRGVPGANPQEYSFLANYSGSVTPSIADGTEAGIQFPNEVFDNGNAFDPTPITGGEYTVVADGDYNFGASISVNWTSAPASGKFRELKVRIKKNGTTVKMGVSSVTGNTATVLIAKQLTGLVAGDVITVTAANKTTDGYWGPTVSGATMTLNQQNSGFEGERIGTIYTGTVDQSNMFDPELKVKDFLTAIIQRFNLVLEPKKNERDTLIIEPFNTWRGSGEVKDWSAKVDHSVRKSIKGTMKDQARFVSFKDAEDSDYLNQFTLDTYKKVFGEKLYEAPSDLTQGTREISNEFFAPTPVINIDGDQGKVMIPAIYEVDNQTKKPIQFEPRLLHFIGDKPMNAIFAYDSNGFFSHQGFWLKDEAGTTHEIGRAGLFHYLDITEAPNQLFPIDENPALVRDLNWNNSDQFHFLAPVYSPQSYFTQRDAIYEYWKEYLNHLYDEETKTVTLNIKFDPTELADIQLNDKIFIDGHYYRINNISSFNLVRPASIQVELITAPLRFTKYPRRRIYNIEGPNTGNTGSGATGTPGGGFTDVTFDDNSVDPSGTGNYVYWDDFTAVTGSGGQLLVSTAAGLDGFDYYPNDSGSANIFTATTQDFSSTRRNFNIGNNDIAFDAYHNTVIGNNNVLGSGVSNSTIYGSNNNIDSQANNVHLYGVNNNVSESVQNTFAVNVANTTLTQISESVILSPTLDVENYESGRVIIGNLRRQGQQYENYKILEGGPGEVYNITGSDGGYFHYHLTYTSSVNGTAFVYLPSASLDEYKDVQYRFTTDNTLTASKLISITTVGGDTIDGNPEETLSTPYDGMTAQNIEGEWIVIQRKK